MKAYLVVIVMVLSGATRELVGAEFATAIVDGLGRPVSNVVVDVHWLKSVSEKDVRKAPVLNLLSDGKGLVSGTYDASSIPKGESLWVELSRKGYAGYTSSKVEPQYILQREWHAEDVNRIATGPGAPQSEQLREVLAGDTDHIRPDLEELLFVQADRFRPALRTLVTDPKVGPKAVWILAFTGVPEDVRFVIHNAPKAKTAMLENWWAYGVVAALLDPTTEEEWSFLRKCAVNEFDDMSIDAGAIETLRLIASPRSAAILAEVRKKNAEREDMVAKALKYIDAKPPPLSDKNLIDAAKKVAHAVRIGTWKGNGNPRYNRAGDMALVDCYFVAGRDHLTYTATLQLVSGEWKLRGVRETMQALLAISPENEPEDSRE